MSDDALRAALDDHELMTNPAECSAGDWSYRDEPGTYFNDHRFAVIRAALASPQTETLDAERLSDDALRAAASRFLDTHPCGSDGDSCPQQAALRAALASPQPETLDRERLKEASGNIHDPSAYGTMYGYLQALAREYDRLGAQK